MTGLSKASGRWLHLSKRSWEIFRNEGVARLLESMVEFVTSLPAWDYAVSRLAYWKYRWQYGSSAPHPYELLYVDPCEIDRWFDLTRFHEIDVLIHGTVIKGGEWDQEYLAESRTKTRFKKTAKSFESHFVEGVPWEETELYRYAMESPDICHLYDPDAGNLERRLNQLDALYENMKNEGYKTQRELENEDLLSQRRDEEIPWYAPPEVHENGVAITRDGEIAGFGGNHRMHLAQVLQLEEMPVRVLIRHEQWQELRDEVASADSIDELRPEAREYVDHPDVQDGLPSDE